MYPTFYTMDPAAFYLHLEALAEMVERAGLNPEDADKIEHGIILLLHQSFRPTFCGISDELDQKQPSLN